MRQRLYALAILLALGLCAHAQKAKLKEVKKYMSQDPAALDLALAASDSTIQDATTLGTAETWYWRGKVLLALYRNEKYGSLCKQCLQESYQSLMKCESIDPKNPWILEIESQLIPSIKNKIFDEAVENYQNGNYTGALTDFEFILQMTPGEVAAISNAAMSAEAGGQFEKAVTYYRQIITLKEHSDKTYASLSKSLLSLNDTAGALTALDEGLLAYPDTVALMFTRINILLASGKGKDALSTLDDAIKRDSKNPSLYLVKGAVYESLAQEFEGKSEAAEFKARSKEAYGQGLAIAPDHFELNFNYGAMIFNEGVALDNGANASKSDKEYKEMKEKAIVKYKEAQPYLEKAYSIRPDDSDVKSSLKQLYFRTGDKEKYGKMN